MEYLWNAEGKMLAYSILVETFYILHYDKPRIATQCTLYVHCTYMLYARSTQHGTLHTLLYSSSRQPQLAWPVIWDDGV